MRYLYGMLGCCLLATFGCSVGGPENASQRTERTTGVYVQMGVTDSQPEQWDGALSIDAGSAEVLHGWRFGRGDRVVDAASWECRSIEIPPLEKAGDLGDGPLDPAKVSLKDILVNVSAPTQAQLSLQTTQGAADVRLSTLQYGRFSSLLNGRARAMATVHAERLSDTGKDIDDDFPSVAADDRGGIWTAWTSYTREKMDHIYARYFDGDEWGASIQLDDVPGDYFRTAVGISGDQVWVIWAAQVDGNFDLYGRCLQDGEWGSTERLTSDAGVDFNHRIAAGPNGTLYMVWQSGQPGGYDIYMKEYRDGQWQTAQRVSELRSNDWEPDAVVDSQGLVTIAWDTYAHGDYDVYMRQYMDGDFTPSLPVTDSDEFEGYVSLACDDKDRVWISYNRAIDHWGKDAPLLGEEPKGHAGTRGLRNSTGVGLLCFEDGRLGKIDLPNPKDMPHTIAGTPEMPELAFDGDGRLWVFFRYLRRNWTTREERFQWDIYGMAYDGTGWTDPMPFPMCYGRNDHRMMAALAADGRLWAVWPTDERSLHPPVGDKTLYQMRDGNIYAGALYPSGQRVTINTPPQKPTLTERTDALRVADHRNHQISVGDENYTLYWGEMHRHTDMSWDGGNGNDGTLYGGYRYALDAAGMDFIGLSDHNYGSRPRGGAVYTPGAADYDWWRSEKYVDLFTVGKFFIPMYTYERSLNYPHGHRNITALKRGSMVVDTFADENGKVRDDDELLLWEELKRRGLEVLMMSHTSATTMGTDWKYPVPPMEPLVEIYQGCRTSYEYEGAPKSQRPESGAKYRDGYIWNALAKGYRLGFIASSDHLSTNVSYAAVYAPELSREGIFRSMGARRTYAAMDHILVDYRLNGRLMGDEFTTSEKPKITCWARGTDNIAKIEIIRDNEFIYMAQPGSIEHSFEFTDTKATPGEHYYYVRVIQENTAIAWASPIWVDYQP
jgi:hypothetical protein